MTLFNQISMIQFDITEVCLYGGGCMHFVFFILRYKHMLLIYPVYIGYSLNDAIGEILNRLKCYFEKAILVILYTEMSAITIMKQLQIMSPHQVYMVLNIYYASLV